MLYLSGDLTSQHINEIKTAFLEAISRFTTIRVSFGEVSEVDFSFLQLLYSAGKSIESKNKKIVFSDTLPPVLRNAAQKLGISCHQLCPGLNGIEGE